MQAINAKTRVGINTFLEEVGADMEIINYNIRENQDFTEQQKREYLDAVSKLRAQVYEVAKKFE